MVEVIRRKQRPHRKSEQKHRPQRKAEDAHHFLVCGCLAVNIRQHRTRAKPPDQRQQQDQRQQPRIEQHHLRQNPGLPVVIKIRVRACPSVYQRGGAEQSIHTHRTAQPGGMRAAAKQFIQIKQQKARPEQVGIDTHKRTPTSKNPASQAAAGRRASQPSAKTRSAAKAKAGKAAPSG